MKRLIRILRATTVGGVLFLAPFVVLVIILGKALVMISSVITPIAESFPFDSLIGLGTPKILSAIILIAICFFVGLFAKTRTAIKIVGWLEKSILSNLPGYSFFKNFGEEVAGTTSTQGYKAVLARFDDSSRIGFLIQRISEGRVVVFIPNAPSPWSGSVYIFNEDRVTPLNTTTASVVNCLGRFGAGAGDVINGSAI